MHHHHGHSHSTNSLYPQLQSIQPQSPYVQTYYAPVGSHPTQYGSVPYVLVAGPQPQYYASPMIPNGSGHVQQQPLQGHNPIPPQGPIAPHQQHPGGGRGMMMPPPPKPGQPLVNGQLVNGTLVNGQLVNGTLVNGTPPMPIGASHVSIPQQQNGIYGQPPMKEIKMGTPPKVQPPNGVIYGPPLEAKNPAVNATIYGPPVEVKLNPVIGPLEGKTAEPPIPPPKKDKPQSRRNSRERTSKSPTPLRNSDVFPTRVSAEDFETKSPTRHASMPSISQTTDDLDDQDPPLPKTPSSAPTTRASSPQSNVPSQPVSAPTRRSKNRSRSPSPLPRRTGIYSEVTAVESPYANFSSFEAARQYRAQGAQHSSEVNLFGPSLEPPPPQKKMDADSELEMFLTGLELAKYLILFRKEEIDFDILRTLDETDLEKIGIPLGPRHKILSALHNTQYNGRKDKKDDVKPKDDSRHVYLDSIAVGKKLGTGHFGEVYSGVWLGCGVALKKLRNPQQVADFIAEADVLLKLRHPNLLAYFGLFVGPNADQYIVTELMSKGSLLDLIRAEKNVFTLPELLELSKDITRGLVCLHSNKIIHRDLALRNVLVTQHDGRYTAKVADFGLAREVNNYYVSTNSRMPYKWSAPESLKFRKFSFKSDVYALAILLWELFEFGTEPYLGMSGGESVAYILSGGRPARPEICTDELFALMSDCWQDDPKSRPSTEEVYTRMSAACDSLLNPPAMSHAPSAPSASADATSHATDAATPSSPPLDPPQSPLYIGDSKDYKDPTPESLPVYKEQGNLLDKEQYSSSAGMDTSLTHPYNDDSELLKEVT
eukprot:TRINITY_DN3026_c0_g1_i3.p1 TRINITY_DN3026_c0_g1~~TRINITY_DN3026_c0_g1_i3.p1  ORF type:complete len:825 (-),score=196.16 TRINITY_DN3026_c0_g1_i3:49-2523(-)